MAFRSKQKKALTLGPIQMLFSSACFAFMAYFAKLATATIPGAEVTFFRLALGVIVPLVFMVQGKVRLITENVRLLFVRGLFGGVAVLLFFLAIEKGTLTNSVVLRNTYPIFAALLSLYILKEKLSFRLCSFIIITFAGIVILIRPEIENIHISDVFALISGLFGGYAVTSVRQLRQKNESVWTIFFYFCVFGAMMSLILAVPFWKWPQPHEYLLIWLTGILGLLGQVTMTAAYKYCTTAVGGILSMTSSLFSFVIGVLLLGERMGILDYVGVFLIVAGNVMVVALEGAYTNQERTGEKI